MSSSDSLRCTYDDARRNTLLQGIALDTRAKVAFFEEMVSFALKFGAIDRLREGRTLNSASSSDLEPHDGS